MPFRSELYDNYFLFCDTHFCDLERRKFIIFSLWVTWVTWVLSFTYTKPLQIHRPFCVFTTENDFCEVFEKNCSCHQGFHQKWFSTKKTFLRKNLKQIGIALLKKRTSKTNKILMTIIKKKSEKAVSSISILFLYKKSCSKNKKWR